MEIVEILGVKFERYLHNGRPKLRKIMNNNQEGLLRFPTQKEMFKHLKLIKKQRRKYGSGSTGDTGF